MGFMERAARKERAEAKERQWPAGNFGLTLRLLREMPDEKMRDFMREVDWDEAEGMVSRWGEGSITRGIMTIRKPLSIVMETSDERLIGAALDAKAMERTTVMENMRSGRTEALNEALFYGAEKTARRILDELSEDEAMRLLMEQKAISALAESGSDADKTERLMLALWERREKVLAKVIGEGESSRKLRREADAQALMNASAQANNPEGCEAARRMGGRATGEALVKAAEELSLEAFEMLDRLREGDASLSEKGVGKKIGRSLAREIEKARESRASEGGKGYEWRMAREARKDVGEFCAKTARRWRESKDATRNAWARELIGELSASGWFLGAVWEKELRLARPHPAESARATLEDEKRLRDRLARAEWSKSEREEFHNVLTDIIPTEEESRATFLERVADIAANHSELLFWDAKTTMRKMFLSERESVGFERVLLEKETNKGGPRRRAKI